MMGDPCFVAIAWTVLLWGGTCFIGGYVWGYFLALRNHTRIFQRPADKETRR